MDKPRDIEEARRRFARSLIGRWATAAGTFAAIMDQRWDIRDDGTGTYTDTGPFGATLSETHFEWLQSEERVFQLRLTRRVAAGDDASLDDDEQRWLSIRYDFIAVATDAGTDIGLIDIAQAEQPNAGFLNSLAPLTYRGR
jgi:hypothetical protein